MVIVPSCLEACPRVVPVVVANPWLRHPQVKSDAKHGVAVSQTIAKIVDPVRSRCRMHRKDCNARLLTEGINQKFNPAELHG